MKQATIYLSVLLFLISCQPMPKAKLKSFPTATVSPFDSMPVAYKDSIRGPFLFTGVYQISRTFVPKDTTPEYGNYLTDTVWYMKVQADTALDPHTHLPLHYTYAPVSKLYVTPFPSPSTSTHH